MRVCAHVYVLSVCARVCVCAPMHMIMFVQIYMHMHAQSKIYIYSAYYTHIYIYIYNTLYNLFIYFLFHAMDTHKCIYSIILDINDINVSI